MVHGALAAGTDSELVRREMIESRKRGLHSQAHPAGPGDGELDPKIDSVDYARFLAPIISGLAVQAVNGATKDDLHNIVEINLRLI